MARAEAGGRLLLVDDDREATEELAELLGSYGLDVTVAPDPATAMARAAQERPDWAVIDLELGDESGVTLATGLRARWPDMGIAFLSGRPLAPAELARLGTTPPPVLTKPLRIDALLALLRPASRDLHRFGC